MCSSDLVKSEIKQKDFAQSFLYFPLVGMVIGIVLSFVYSIFGFLPNLVTSVLVLIVSIVITGGIHVDEIGRASCRERV